MKHWEGHAIFLVAIPKCMCNLIIRKHAPNGGAYYEITDQYSKSSKVMKGKERLRNY